MFFFRSKMAFLYEAHVNRECIYNNLLYNIHIHAQLTLTSPSIWKWTGETFGGYLCRCSHHSHIRCDAFRSAHINTCYCYTTESKKVYTSAARPTHSQTDTEMQEVYTMMTMMMNITYFCQQNKTTLYLYSKIQARQKVIITYSRMFSVYDRLVHCLCWCVAARMNVDKIESAKISSILGRPLILIIIYGLLFALKMRASLWWTTSRSCPAS